MKTKRMPAYFALAFVWFTTHFGGGFAAGTQLNSYFIKYGSFSLIMPFLSQALLAVVFYFAWKYAKDFKLYNYRDWTDSFYGPTSIFMSNAYDFIFNMTLVIATAVAFATGGSTIEQVFGTPYILNTVVIATVIFLFTIYGADMVRKVATYIAISIIASLLIIFVPNIITFWPQLIQNISQLGAMSNGDFWGAIWKALLYAGFQACAIGAYISHVDSLKDKGEIRKASFWGLIINGGLLFIATLGLLTFYGEELTTATVPTLVVVNKGIGTAFMKPLVSVLIIIGSVSTGVNLIYGIVNRIVSFLGRNESIEVAEGKQKKRSIVTSMVYVLLTWSVAQFGLIPLIAKGYGSVGILAIFIIMVPILVRGIIGWEKQLQNFRKNDEATRSN